MVLSPFHACRLVHIRRQHCPSVTFEPIWRGTGIHIPSPGKPHGVRMAVLVGLGFRHHGNPSVSAAHRCHTAHPGPAEVAPAGNNNRLGSVDRSRASLPHAWGVCAAHSALATPSTGASHGRDRLPRGEARCARDARSAACAHQLCRAPGGSARQWLQRAATGGSLLAPGKWANADPQPQASAGTCGRRALPWKYAHFGCEATCDTLGVMVARAWSGLMCLETQGKRGGAASAGSGRRGRGFDQRPILQYLYKRGSALEAALAAGCSAARTRSAFGPKRGDLVSGHGWLRGEARRASSRAEEQGSERRRGVSAWPRFGRD